jgi:DNA-binding protein HU-beta
MTKAEIVAEISKKTGVDREKSLKVVEALMVSIKEHTVAGDDIFLRGFGTFTSKVRAQKVGRIIKENKSVVVPEHRIPFFKPCEEYRAQMAE